MKSDYLKTLAIAIFCTPTIVAAKSARNTPKKCETEKPNVILIYADDMGKGMLTAYGQKYIDTPNIDKIVNQGVQFTQAYGCHFSAPARASLLTGYSDCHAGHWNNVKGGVMIVNDTTKIAGIEAEINASRVQLPSDDEYLAQVFTKAGYVTGEIGKLDYSFCSTREEVKSHGWDYYYGFLDHQACHGFFPPFLYENGKIVMIEGNTHANCAKAAKPYDDDANVKARWNMDGKKQYSQDLFNAKIKNFLKENKDKPFFLYHPTQLPHGPVGIPYMPEEIENKHYLTLVEKEYAAMMYFLDEAVGKILDELDELGIADKTMVVFSVDNGHEIYYEQTGRTTSYHDLRSGRTIDDHYIRFSTEAVGDIFNGNAGMSGKKRSNLDGGVRVPLSFYMPSKLKPRVCDQLVSNYDFIATMADMLDVNINKGKSAVSYYPLLECANNKLPDDRFVVVDSYEGPSIMTNDGWKLRYCNVTTSYELYNLRYDYKESNDLSEQYPEVTARLRKLMSDNVQTTMCRGKYVR